MLELVETAFKYIYLFIKTYVGIWGFITFLEFIFPADKKQKIFSKHSLNELLNGFILAAFIWPIDSSLRIFIAEHWFAPFFPYQILNEYLIELPYFIQIIIALFLLDSIQYIRHRVMHSKWLWTLHAMHHSAIELRSSVHWRFHPVEYLLVLIFNVFCLHLIGFNGGAIQWAITLITINNMWLHANINIDYGPLRSIITSPNYHKWHHATSESASNKNFADIFVILDKIGGTYYFPKNKNPDEFGLSNESKSSSLHHNYFSILMYPISQFLTFFKKEKY